MFYLNFDDFSVFKLKSIVFLVYFPLTFTEMIMNLWSKLIPNLNSQEISRLKSKEEEIAFDLESIAMTKQAIKEFSGNLVVHLKSLLEYLQQVKEEDELRAKYKFIA